MLPVNFKAILVLTAFLFLQFDSDQKNSGSEKNCLSAAVTKGQRGMSCFSKRRCIEALLTPVGQPLK